MLSDGAVVLCESDSKRRVPFTTSGGYLGGQGVGALLARASEARTTGA
jgi:hypothetical protein